MVIERLYRRALVESSPASKRADHRRRGWMVVALTVVLGLTFAFRLVGGPTVSAQDSKSVVWNRFDVTLDVREDGTIHVTERQVIDFQGGPFTGGFADIPLGRLDGLGNLLISEETDQGVQSFSPVQWDNYDEDPGTYSATTTSSEVSVRYGFDSVTNGERTFILEYDVAGVIRVYADAAEPNQQIWWTAISDQVTDIAPIRESTTTINLPTSVGDLSKVKVSGPGDKEWEGVPADHTTDGKTFTWTASNLDSGDFVEVRLQFPPIIQVAAPSWQQKDDEQRKQDEENDQRSALYNAIFLGIALLGLAGGGAGIYGLWYSRGRDPHTGVVADFIPTPPDDLPPGAAGTLIDEVAQERDVTATLVDLANRGVLKMEETQSASPAIFGSSRDFNLTALQTDPKVTPFEQELLRSLFGRTLTEGQTVKLSDVKSRFVSATPKIKDLLYEELVTRGYFPRSPEKTRNSWRSGGFAALAIIAIAGCAIGALLSTTAVLIWAVVVVFMGLALAVVGISGAMPRKTLPGAEAAAKWRAFRKYLEDIEKYEKVDESREIFDKYLPYAVAFGLEHSWVTKFASVGTATPGWFGPVLGGPFLDPTPGWGPTSRRRGGPIIIAPGGLGNSGGGQRSDGGGVDLPDMPDLQKTSDRAGRSLQGSSDTLLDMFNSAAKIFGGFGGGGGGRGGGWGGGGGGFGGGGSHGGSSGGGGRGFH